MLETLKKYFGYTEFRPLQKEIIAAITSRKDVFVLMPTGGGKSLCYQLPSIMQNGLTVVVSPLISLMKDQVDSLRDNGIAAAYINSSLSFEEISNVKAQLRQNKIKLLYMAPERLMMPQFLEFIKSLPIGLIAIDEAHCISEWGHDFRPEYRQLVILKDEFSQVPLAALTATATPMVQNDITQLLKMDELSLFKASFNRPNLFYRVLHKSDTYQRLVDYLKAHPNESGIIYCQSRKTVDSLADSLTFDGFRALPYHAGMESSERSKNQDKFIKDDVDIIVATIAFGMGIDKPNVRFVFHYDLPKNLESYYQETGRAGRDGLQSDCILFFSYGDKNKIEYFIEEKENPKEKEIAYNKLHQMIAFCESQMCRRKVILEYFGETYEVDNCGLCDNCIDYKDGREKFDGTVIAQKMLSCVYRLDQRFGMNYVIDVLWGSKSERIFQNGHQHLSTYGVGKKINKKRWQVFARELIQQGYLIMEGGQYPVLRLTEKLSVNESLFERLRQLRKRIADERNIPPYIIFHDKTLKEMAGRMPTSWGDLSTIFGMGEAKLKQYGPRFLKEIVAFVQDRDLGR